MKLFRATGIVYDTDGEELNLPTTMDIQCESEDMVADAISDETGFLIETIENIVEL